MAGSRPLTDEEIALVLDSFKGRFATRNKSLFIYGIRTGFRISEILALKVKDIEQHGKIVDTVTIERRFMKGKKKSRSVVLHRDAKQALANILDEYERQWGRRMEADMYVFKSQTGVNRPLSRSHVASIFHKIYDEHRFTGKLGTHVLRKCFAARMFRLFDKDIVKVQRAMLHENINSTIKYLQNFTQDEIDNAILT